MDGWKERWLASMSHCTWLLHPAFILLLGGWIWCRLTHRGHSLWRAPPACRPPGRSLNQRTERGTSLTLCRGERSPRAPSPCTTPPPCNPQPPPCLLPSATTPSLKTLHSGRLWGLSTEDIILHWQIIQHLYYNVWKSLLLDVQDTGPAVWFTEFTWTFNRVQKLPAFFIWSYFNWRKSPEKNCRVCGSSRGTRTSSLQRQFMWINRLLNLQLQPEYWTSLAVQSQEVKKTKTLWPWTDSSAMFL